MAEALLENVRIDKGVKRGPRLRQGKPTNPSDTADIGTWVIPKDLDPDEVLAQYLAASKTSQIAKQYGLSRKALTKWLREKRPEAWKHVQIIRALTDKEDGRDGIAEAPDALSLARARELLKAGQWDLERLDSGTFGVKIEQTIDVNHHVLVEHGLAESALTLFDHMRGLTHTQPPALEDKEEGG